MESRTVEAAAAESAPADDAGPDTNTEAILSPPSTRATINEDVFVGQADEIDATDAAVTPNNVTVGAGMGGPLQLDDEVAVAEVNVGASCATFPATQPVIQNLFTHLADDDAVEKGYDSEGELPYIDDSLVENEFDEQPLPVGGGQPPPPPPPVAAAAPTVALTEADVLECPNYKVHECQHIWKKAWLPGKQISIDEQTAKMQGTSQYKTRCGKFKRIGDGIQLDSLAS